MLFRVVRKIDNRAMMGTDYVNCIRFDWLDNQERAGYYFKVNEKRMNASQVKLHFADYLKAKEDAVPEVPEVNEDIPKKTVQRKVRRIRCVNTGKEYINMSACARDLNIDPAAVSYSMQKGKPTTGGFSFEFVD